MVRELTEEEIEAHTEITEIDSELRATVRRALRLVRLLDAKQILLSEHIQQSDERLESADIRGLAIGLRETSEKTPVVVVYTPEAQD